MGLQFLLGRAGTNKSDWILNDIRQKLRKDAKGPAIFYIVPDQMTFQQEYALFQDKEISGSMRAQVVSFSRLAWRILQETGGSTKQFISSVGIQMMLRKIIDDRQTNWRVFQKAVEKTGFLPQLEQMITEFKRYDISPDMLKSQQNQMNKYVHQTTNEAALVDKLDDLSYIYEQLIVALQGHYIDTEDQLDLLVDKIQEATIVEDAEIYFDGFHRFTPKELRVVEALMKKGNQTTVALTLDEHYKDKHSELDLYYQTKETYHILKETAEENSLRVDEPIYLHISNDHNLMTNYPHFIHLEQNFDTRPSPPFQGEVPVDLVEAVHPRAEVEGVAQQIISLVRDKGYRYKDIAIFIREPEAYNDLIQTIFNDYHLPVFIDDKRTMLNHPLIEFIRSALEIVKSNWRYDTIFRVLKTGFLPSSNNTHPLTDEAIDELENYVLEYGIRARNRWFGSEEWIFQRFRGFDQAVQTDKEREIQTRINAYRHQVVKALQSFDEQIREAGTIREFSETIFLLLEALRVPDQLQILQKSFDEQGQFEKGREQEQVWDAVMELFNEIVEIAGDETITLSGFCSTLDAGFESLQFAHVPPSIDHVIVGSIDRSRIGNKKCAFLLGVTDGIWPMKPPIDGMMNEQEREILAEHGLQLAESSRRKLLDDWFYIYLAFTTAQQRLWVSYPLSDEEGKAKMPSQLIQRMKDLFPSCEQPILLQDPEELIEADRFITTPEKTRAALTAQLARNERGYQMKPIWLHVLNWYIHNEQLHETTYAILQSLYYENKPRHLSLDTAEKLYPKQVNTSVSRLEMYYRCSYQHFAQYNLKLQERKTYKLDAPDIGQLFHEALKTITEWIQDEGQEFAKLTNEDADSYARKAVEKLAPILQNQILHSSNRYQYIQKKLQEVIARATFVLSEQARATHFSPVGIELGFGDGKDDQLQAKKIQLPNGYELVLRGRIDRVDKATSGEDLYLRIIDYKSSAHGLSLLDVYYGLALQMLTYLDVVLTESEHWLGLKASPAGILYFHVHNAMLSKDDDLTEEKIATELFKQYKMQGLLLSDEEIVQLMDTSLQSGTSQIVPAGIKKNGGFYSSSKIASDDTFSTLQSHIDQLIIHAGLDMTSGKVHLNPYAQKHQTACTYCPFRSVCQFDPILEHNEYRNLMQMNDDEVLDKLRKEEEETW